SRLQLFFFSSRRRHTRFSRDWSSDVCSSDLDEVQDVLHPAAYGSDRVYDFRLADSTTIVLPGAPEPVRVYEVQVRPRNPAASGFVGSVFIDRARGDIVRMTFTFTPASYVDRQIGSASWRV